MIPIINPKVKNAPAGWTKKVAATLDSNNVNPSNCTEPVPSNSLTNDKVESPNVNPSPIPIASNIESNIVLSDA